MVDSPKSAIIIKIEPLETDSIARLSARRSSQRIIEKRQVKKAPATTRTEIDAKLKPKNEETKTTVKIKQEDKPFALSGDSVARRLAPYLSSQIHVPATVELLTPVLRSFISQRYGGGLVPMLPTTNKKKRKLHGIEGFAFLKAEYNPNMPTGLGEPGLAFRNPEDVVGRDPMPVFVQTAKNYWLYCGHYVFHESEPLSVEEWQQQARTVQDTWVGNFFAKLWPTHMSAPIIQKRIAKYMIEKERRQTGSLRGATPKEIDRFIEQGRHRGMTTEILRQDLDSGTTRPPCCALECVEYDPAFQRELLAGQRSPEKDWRTFPESLIRQYRRKMAVREEEKRESQPKRVESEVEVEVQVKAKMEKRRPRMVLDYVDVPPMKRRRI